MKEEELKLSKKNIETTNQNRLSEIFNSDLSDDFEENPEQNAKKYLEDIISGLDDVYDNIYDKDLGVEEGYSLKEHTGIVINQFARYYEQLNNRLPYFLKGKEFLQMLAVHDIGKVSKEVQSLKEKGVEKEIWKEEEEKQTLILASEIYERFSDLDKNKLNIILEVLGEGSRKMDAIVTGKNNPKQMAEYVIKKSDELFISNPKDFLNILEVYLICDASAYTTSAVENFEFEDTKIDKDSILSKYSDGDISPFDGLGVNSWFKVGEEDINFANSENDRYGASRAKDRIEKTKILLDSVSKFNKLYDTMSNFNDYLGNYLTTTDALFNIINEQEESSFLEDDSSSDGIDSYIRLKKRLVDSVDEEIGKWDYDIDQEISKDILELMIEKKGLPRIKEKIKIVDEWIEENFSKK